MTVRNMFAAPRSRSWPAAFISGLVVALGFTALWGWHTHSPRIAGWVAVPASIGLALWGLAALSLIWRDRDLSGSGARAARVKSRLEEAAGGELEREIAGRRRHDEEVARLNRELRGRVAELMAVNHELESFNYSVSHDLRAPLRHIDGYSKYLLEEYGAELPHPAHRYLEQIRQGARRMGRMVDELLELSHITRLDVVRQATGLNSLVDEVLAELTPELEGRHIEWRIGELPFVDCDPTLTRQVFANLLSNAVKFSRPRKPAIIELGRIPHGGQPVLFVRDNGVGFSMKYAHKLFGAFQRLHRREEFEGTGVGLATVQRIIHKHGGKIWTEAELDKGAAFFFTLGPGEPQPGPGGAETEVVAGAR